MNPIIAPSILNADYGHLANEIQMLNQSEAEWIHLDVMDGMFVPNISFGTPIVKTVNALTTKFVDVHLMIEKPERYLKEFKDAGANGITIHYEATDDLSDALEEIKSLGCKTGVSIKPDTSVDKLAPFLPQIDLVLIMSVYPGFGGQKFIHETYERVAQIKKEISTQNLNTLIQVDGGVNADNIRLLADEGTDVFVVGSFIFRSTNPIETIRDLKSIAGRHAV